MLCIYLYLFGIYLYSLFFWESARTARRTWFIILKLSHVNKSELPAELIPLVGSATPPPVQPPFSVLSCSIFKKPDQQNFVNLSNENCWWRGGGSHKVGLWRRGFSPTLLDRPVALLPLYPPLSPFLHLASLHFSHEDWWWRWHLCRKFLKRVCKFVSSSSCMENVFQICFCWHFNLPAYWECVCECECAGVCECVWVYCESIFVVCQKRTLGEGAN